MRLSCTVLRLQVSRNGTWYVTTVFPHHDESPGGGVEMTIMDLQGLEVPGERDAQALGSTISGGC
ncbi:hypothetical protein SAMN05428954_3798 [Streptomyces sp. 2112.3]|nr:hypothetical protein [Streptomyces sp. 2112.3]SEE76397.1 hypothetical protein SAMN05428954_3798 [Streptomyces sp. 2112.3]